MVGLRSTAAPESFEFGSHPCSSLHVTAPYKSTVCLAEQPVRISVMFASCSNRMHRARPGSLELQARLLPGSDALLECWLAGHPMHCCGVHLLQCSEREGAA